MVDSSSGKKLSIVDVMVVCPHVSDACTAKKFPYTEGEILEHRDLVLG